MLEMGVIIDAKDIKKVRVINMKWVDAIENKPLGFWSPNHHHLSEEVLIANTAGVVIGCYDRNTGIWYVGNPTERNWIDKITHWMYLPKSPHK